MSDLPNTDQEEQQPEFTPEELAAMTDEERKALTDEDEGGTNDGQKEEEQKEDGAGDQGRQEVAPDKSGPPHQTFVPFIQVGATEDIQTKLDALDQQLEEGDIDIIQYTKQRDPLIQQRTESELVAKFNQQSGEQLWQYEQRLFFNTHPQYRDNAVLNGALSKVFKGLDTQENAGRTGFELLNEAREQVESQLSSLFGGKKPESPATPAKKDDAKPIPVKDGKSALEKVELPRTLATVPVAEQNDTGRDEFAHLDALSGLDFEKALSRLTPDQRDRYERV
jgi:hypothetical protein